MPVHRGNLVKPGECTKAPEVSLFFYQFQVISPLGELGQSRECTLDLSHGGTRLPAPGGWGG